MSLKLIPLEPQLNSASGIKQKQFNPGNKIKRNASHKQRAGHQGSLKNLCLRLVHFINRGSRFTYEQVDDLIVSLHRGILKLQERKSEIINHKKNRFNKKKSKE